MASRRPELQGPAAEFYSVEGAAKYVKSSRINQVQTSMAERCMELLAIPPGEEALLLDIGTGTGLSGEVLSKGGHHWVGFDISSAMLAEALEKDVDGDLIEADAGLGVPFRMGTLDGAISVSAIQWLCNAETSEQNPHRRINAFFATLYQALRKSARAVLQFYPENPTQIELLTAAAMRAGFSGGLLVDYPNSSKAKKYFLCLTAGPPTSVNLPKPLGVEMDTEVKVASRRPKKKGRHSASLTSDAVSKRDWIIRKKEKRRRHGHDVKHDSRYTGRKRKDRF